MDVLNSTLLSKALKQLQIAVTADKRGHSKEALMSYMEGATMLMDLTKNDQVGAQMKPVLQRKCQQYIDRVRTIKSKVEAGETAHPLSSFHPLADSLDDDDFLQEMLSLDQSETCKATFEEVRGLKEVKDFLWRNVAVPLMFPGFPDPVTRTKRGILFYGLAGSGKTLMIKALMSTVACSAVRIAASSFVSSYSGAEASIERMKKLFQWARSHQPCIVCLDDIDVLCEPTSSSDSISSQVLEEFIGSFSDMTANSKVLVIAAALRPWYLSGKLSRRFDRRFCFHLPEAADRAMILRHHLHSVSDVVCTLTESDFRQVGEHTAGFTGADMVVLARTCAMETVRLLQSATHFKFVSHLSESDDDCKSRDCKKVLMPCSPDIPGALEISVEFLNLDRVRPAPLTMVVVSRLLADSKPSVSFDDEEKLKRWMQEFGQED